MNGQVLGFYVLLGSECCGIDRQALEKVQNLHREFEKKHKMKLTYETLSWGKEGEKVLYFVAPPNVNDTYDDFAEKVLKAMQKPSYKLVTARVLLEFHSRENIFWAHFIPFGINEKRENNWLAYVAQQEKAWECTLLKGSRINETGLEVDQDKRYEVDLGKLKEKQKEEFIRQSKAIFAKAEE